MSSVRGGPWMIQKFRGGLSCCWQFRGGQRFAAFGRKFKGPPLWMFLPPSLIRNQLLLTWFWPNLKGKFLGQDLPKYTVPTSFVGMPCPTTIVGMLGVSVLPIKVVGRLNVIQVPQATRCFKILMARNLC